jgi:hypothetical protein
MKIIDLLNKIANWEEVPKFWWNGCIHEVEKEYETNKYSIFDTYCKKYKRIELEDLNDEIKFLEEEKKIPEKLEEFGLIQYNLDYIDYKNIETLKEWLNKDFQTIYDTLDLLIKNQNKLIDYLKSKGE